MIEVYKYGGSILNIKENRNKIYKFLKEKISKGNKIFMVVSAFGRNGDGFSTDDLSKNIELLDNKDKDQIITFGEIYSSLIIKNELKREGVKVNSVNYDEIGIVCDNNYQNGNIVGIDMNYLKEQIEDNDIVIVPGFIAESLEGKIISLGRNTSDLTAVIIADFFKLKKVHIIKDVNGVYKKDPKIEKNKKIISEISYDEMLSIIKAGSKMFAGKTIEFAKDKNITIEIKGIDKEKGTIISDKTSSENILFINYENNTIKIVFKDMNIFNELFNEMITNRIKLEELVVDNNVIYIKAESNKIKNIIEKYL